ncbi:MAG: hypothetical protein ABIG20_03425 [archaeon]
MKTKTLIPILLIIVILASGCVGGQSCDGPGEFTKTECCSGLVRFEFALTTEHEPKEFCVNEPEEFCSTGDCVLAGECVGPGEYFVLDFNSENPYGCCEGLDNIWRTDSDGYCVYEWLDDEN